MTVTARVARLLAVFAAALLGPAIGIAQPAPAMSPAFDRSDLVPHPGTRFGGARDGEPSPLHLARRCEDFFGPFSLTGL